MQNQGVVADGEKESAVSIPISGKESAVSIPISGKESAVSIPISEKESAVSIPISEGDDWANFADDDIMQQQSAIHAEEAKKVPFVGDKEPLSMLAAEYESGSPILLEKIKVLEQQYAAIRRTRGDGNCFFRSFMFSYLEHILESQDRAEVDRIKGNVEECRKTLQGLGYADFTFEDFFALFIEQLDCALQGNEDSISRDELILRSRDQSISDYVVMFFRFVTSGEIRKRSEFFEPFILGLTNATVEQFCKSSVEPMGEESDHVHITALSDALGVPIRVVYLDPPFLSSLLLPCCIVLVTMTFSIQNDAFAFSGC
ncbi:hypothetical protein V6N11_024131 [Hibiscus sabdariffa]|uniref:ubiquitinyl hydrolase 1 n=1 Tax=Hibiscus sabdariffa TaxID=183260 RepID=A0ABR1ZV48_9ROSI